MHWVSNDFLDSSNSKSESELIILKEEMCRMESSGKPGMVHISEKTYSFLEEEYYVQKAEDLEGI